MTNGTGWPPRKPPWPRTRRRAPPVAFPAVGGTSDDDDEVDGDVPLGGPVHPDDRLWRHPSEVASAGLPAAAERQRTPRRPAGSEAGSDSRPGVDVPPRSRRGRGFGGLWLPITLAGTVGALLSAGLLSVTGRFGVASGELQPVGPTSSTIALTVSSHPAAVGVADLAERLRPSLVAVSGKAADGRVTRGSAVAIRADHVLTAARLVAASSDLEVLVGSVVRRARLVGADADTDLAVLAVDSRDLVPVSWGAAADLRPGDPAVAVSSAPTAEPGPTVTAGIVSGLARTITHGGIDLRGLLQVDRPVPAEGAGGALLNPSGALVGITLPASPASAPFGYAVPAEVAREVARQLLTRGRVAHPWLGVEGSDRGTNGGAVVQRVKPASPAATAGLLDGDVLLQVDGQATPTMGMLLVALRRHHPGDTIHLLVLRGERTLDVAVILAERP